MLCGHYRPSERGASQTLREGCVTAPPRGPRHSSSERRASPLPREGCVTAPSRRARHSPENLFFQSLPWTHVINPPESGLQGLNILNVFSPLRHQVCCCLQSFFPVEENSVTPQPWMAQHSEVPAVQWHGYQSVSLSSCSPWLGDSPKTFTPAVLRCLWTCSHMDVLNFIMMFVTS